jgi:hypothetical protein
MKLIIFATLILSYFSISLTLANEQPGVTDLISESLEIKKSDDSEQIDLDQGGKVEGGVTIMDAGGRRNVSMACFTTENGHRIKITVKNQNRSVRKCSTQCYFKTSGGGTGVQRCEGKISGNYDGEFCSKYASNYTYKVTDPGSFDCHR